MGYNAAAFLESLFNQVPRVSSIPASDLPAGLQEEFDERAGILEFDAGLPRDQAEAQALMDIVTGISHTEQKI